MDVENAEETSLVAAVFDLIVCLSDNFYNLSTTYAYEASVVSPVMLSMIFWYVAIFGRVASSMVAFHESVLAKFLIPAARESVPAVAEDVFSRNMFHLFSNAPICFTTSVLRSSYLRLTMFSRRADKCVRVLPS